MPNGGCSPEKPIAHFAMLGVKSVHVEIYFTITAVRTAVLHMAGVKQWGQKFFFGLEQNKTIQVFYINRIKYSII